MAAAEESREWRGWCPDVVFYHNNCMDGVASAYAVHCSVPDDKKNDVEYVAWQYGPVSEETFRESIKPSIVGKKVLYVDYLIPTEWLYKVCEVARDVRVIDHHLTTAQDLRDWPHLSSVDNFRSIVDLGHSACVLSWDAFNKDEMPWFFRYVEDYDLWRFLLSDSKAVNLALNTHVAGVQSARSAEQSKAHSAFGLFGVWTNYDNARINDMKVGGNSMLMFQGTMVAQLSKRYFVVNHVTQRNHTVYLVHSAILRNEIADELLCNYSECDIVGIYSVHIERERIVCSLRSCSNTHVDCAAIAKSLGGGGHRSAAAFRVDGTSPTLHLIPALKNVE